MMISCVFRFADRMGYFTLYGEKMSSVFVHTKSYEYTVRATIKDCPYGNHGVTPTLVVDLGILLCNNAPFKTDAINVSSTH